MALPRAYGLLLDAVRGLTWPARTRVSGNVSGSHLSRLHGRAPELSEYRLYRQGDDPRQLDWKLLARSDRPFIRLSDDRAVHATWFLLDGSASMDYPPPAADKWRAACAVTMGLAAVAQRAGDPVGALVIGGGRTVRVPPRTRSDVLVELAEALGAVAPGGEADLAAAMVAIPARARCVIVSDLLGDEPALRAAAARHTTAGDDLHCVHVVSRAELEPPASIRLAVDPERQALQRVLDDESRTGYRDAFAAWRTATARAWRLAGVSYREVLAEDDATRVVRAIATARPDHG